MVSVSDLSICYFLRKGMNLHDMNQLCDTRFFSENSKVDIDFQEF